MPLLAIQEHSPPRGAAGIKQHDQLQPKYFHSLLRCGACRSPRRGAFGHRRFQLSRKPAEQFGGRGGECGLLCREGKLAGRYDDCSVAFMISQQLALLHNALHRDLALIGSLLIGLAAVSDRFRGAVVFQCLPRCEFQGPGGFGSAKNQHHGRCGVPVTGCAGNPQIRK
jgi:hypothetical protein